MNGSSTTKRSAPLLADFSDQDRLRITTGIISTFALHGYRETTVEHLRVQIDPEVFDALFCDKEDCFLLAYDQLLGEARKLIAASLPTDRDWPERLAAGLSTALELIDANPNSAKFVLVQAQNAPPAVAAHHFATIERVVPFMREGRAFSASYIPPFLDSTLPLGVAYALGVHLTEQPEQPVADLCSELLRLLLLPYLGDVRTEDFLGRRARRLRKIDPLPRGN